jgi:hypothetical protein
VVHCSLRERFLSDHCVDRVTGERRRKGTNTDGGILGAHRRKKEDKVSIGKRPTAEKSK